MVYLITLLVISFVVILGLSNGSYNDVWTPEYFIDENWRQPFDLGLRLQAATSPVCVPVGSAYVGPWAGVMAWFDGLIVDWLRLQALTENRSDPNAYIDYRGPFGWKDPRAVLCLDRRGAWYEAVYFRLFGTEVQDSREKSGEVVLAGSKQLKGDSVCCRVFCTLFVYA